MRLGAEVAISEHPDHGLRAQPDEMANATDKLVVPTGSGAPRSAAEPFEEAVKEFLSAARGCADGDGFVAEVAFGDVSSRCQVLPGTRHPVYGAGLLILGAASPTPAEPGCRFALALNDIELTREPLGYGFGSYAWRDGWMYFISFEAVYGAGPTASLVASCAQRGASIRSALRAD